LVQVLIGLVVAVLVRVPVFRTRGHRSTDHRRRA
jgi:hypothetical protein